MIDIWIDRRDMDHPQSGSSKTNERQTQPTWVLWGWSTTKSEPSWQEQMNLILHEEIGVLTAETQLESGSNSLWPPSLSLSEAAWLWSGSAACPFLTLPPLSPSSSQDSHQSGQKDWSLSFKGLNEVSRVEVCWCYHLRVYGKVNGRFSFKKQRHFK